ncbi:MAG: nucleotide exchange factor GrpE [Elusimicrobia bacterium]|nr:nucleotide exchange factor GrpE [Elusimicrobiota bacterium]MBD3412247.1 nucleotide exchange factor GrpE [Elusimicrobiota bacterium]
MSEQMDHKKEEPCADVLASAQEEKIAEQQILKETIDKKNREITAYRDQLLRLQAEFENYRKRVEREKREYLAWGKEDILMRIIMLQDVLEQAQNQARTTENIQSVKTGLELIHKEFEKFLKSEGVSAIDVSGEHFDPHQHEAIEIVEQQGDREKDVLEELQKGYRFNNRIIRPARVKVLRIKPGEKAESKETDTASNNQKNKQ